MLDNKLLKLIGITSEILDFDHSVVEKDYYITQNLNKQSFQHSSSLQASEAMTKIYSRYDPIFL